MSASLVGEALMGLGCLTFCFVLTGCGALLLALRFGATAGLAEKFKALLNPSLRRPRKEAPVTFDPGYAEDVALPSACVLVQELFPHATGPTRERLVRRVAEILMTALLAFCEFQPPGAVPAPSQN